MIDKTKLPSSIRSIILSIDEELQEAFQSQNINQFIESISALLDYYYPSLFNQIYNNDNEYTEIYFVFTKDLNLFIDVLTTGIYQRLEMINLSDNQDKFFTKEYLYDEIIEIIIHFYLKQYYKLIIQYAKTNNLYVWAFSTNLEQAELVRLINDYKTLQLLLPHLDIFSLSVYTIDKFIDKIDVSINQDIKISFYNMPRVILGNVKKLLYELSKYEQFVTKKDIYFINEKFDQESFIEIKDNKIDYSQGYSNILYNIIYLLLKDKLIKYLEDNNLHEYWRNIFAKILSTQYIADEVIIVNHYMYHLRAQVNYIEYFMSVIIAFILDNEKLKIGDLCAYKQVQRILLPDSIGEEVE